jgi:hypothetical protein
VTGKVDHTKKVHEIHKFNNSRFWYCYHNLTVFLTLCSYIIYRFLYPILNLLANKIFICHKEKFSTLRSSRSWRQDLWNFGVLQQHYTASQPRRHRHESSSPRKLHSRRSFQVRLRIILVPTIYSQSTCMTEYHTFKSVMYEGVSKSFRTESITK